MPISIARTPDKICQAKCQEVELAASAWSLSHVVEAVEADGRDSAFRETLLSVYLGEWMRFWSARSKVSLGSKCIGCGSRGQPSLRIAAALAPTSLASRVVPASGRTFSTSGLHSTAMGKKTSAERKEDHGTDLTLTGKKPCRTCGREMTPDPRQIAAGNTVETCSHSCRTFKIGKKTNRALVTEGTLYALRDRLQDLRMQNAGSPTSARYLACAVEQLIRLASHTSKAQTVSADEPPIPHAIDVDAWIELVILAIAPASSTTSNFPKGEDVEAAMREVTRTEDEALNKAVADGSLESGNPKRTLCTTLESGPGSRERVRRSLRRLFILPQDKWACGEMVEETSKGIDVLQNGKVVDGLAGVSFAKGPMQFRARAE